MDFPLVMVMKPSLPQNRVEDLMFKRLNGLETIVAQGYGDRFSFIVRYTLSL